MHELWRKPRMQLDRIEMTFRLVICGFDPGAVLGVHAGRVQREQG